MIETLEVVDYVLHFLFLLAVSPLVLVALCWVRYGPPGSAAASIAHPHKVFGEVMGA